MNMLLNKLPANVVALIILLTCVFNANANDTWIPIGETPTWNGDNDIIYRTKFNNTVRGFLQIGSGYNIATGFARFNFLDADEVSRFVKHRYQKEAGVFPVKMEVFLDEQPFFELVNMNKSLSRAMYVHFPFKPRKVTVKSLFNNNENYQMSVNINNMPHSMKGFDVRKNPMSSADKLDKVYVHKGSGLIYFSCASSKKSGPIKRITSVLQKHPIFAPHGNRKLGVVNIMMPIYELDFYQASTLRLKFKYSLTGNQRYENHTYTIKNECETVNGKIFKAKEDITIFRDSRSFDGR